MNTSIPEPRTIARTLGAIVFVVVVAAFLVTAIPGVVGADQSFVVRSSSMSPAISAGDVVIVETVPPETISERDVITFRSPGNADNRVTHRVVEVVGSAGAREFVTKGDANASPDDERVQPGDVLGAVAFTIPFIGYVVTFANSDVGLVALVIVPALLLVGSELWDLFTEPPVETADTDGGDS